ncbi:hypothetical protein [Parerythrobacter lacustris]|uniref:DUF403 domain-containing protein n=1 Tax=Parerythrobacter lacustris TaxID=2969984 RepID=A0ABT1XN50_9SPHN|nr:hypothetical protein [Parerythrobacter lacustris]MCR2832992.1 hypothetical protein [Parerythrobacter lacustris]
MGVIINADCDLANGKLDGVIAYLPMYSFKEYITKFWAPGHVAEVLSSATDRILEAFGDASTSSESLHNWISSDGHETVSRALTASSSIKRGKVASITQDVRRLAIALNEEMDLFSRFKLLCQAEQDALGYARRQFIAARKAMGDGHFQISDLVEHPDIGFVIRMRRIYTIPERLCFNSVSEQMANSDGCENTAVRIGRLTELYRFKVAQLFAQQFSRIGLPDELTALAGLAIDDLVHDVVKDLK